MGFEPGDDVARIPQLMDQQNRINGTMLSLTASHRLYFAMPARYEACYFRELWMQARLWHPGFHLFQATTYRFAVLLRALVIVLFSSMWYNLRDLSLAKASPEALK